MYIEKIKITDTNELHLLRRSGWVAARCPFMQRQDRKQKICGPDCVMFSDVPLDAEGYHGEYDFEISICNGKTIRFSHLIDERAQSDSAD